MVAVRVPVVDFKLLVGLGSREASAEDTSEVLHKALGTCTAVVTRRSPASGEIRRLVQQLSEN